MNWIDRIINRMNSSSVTGLPEYLNSSYKSTNSRFRAELVLTSWVSKYPTISLKLRFFGMSKSGKNASSHLNFKVRALITSSKESKGGKYLESGADNPGCLTLSTALALMVFTTV
ncbi:hypothetical protein WICPIJ_000508 [Wickerhamomyces pijperi]|uniref:Uncharacterized protein n=1 Tax=Wickerhamomyces pijperi TaxID=599730 RepID=A0A9P8TQT0_WICPI|nr:hypothetical protein WICPIJ_000508 [Wickerhamomyces pijperi]